MMLNNIFYMYSNMDSSSQILLFLIVLVALMLVSIFIINHITKKRNEKYDMMYNPIDRYTKTIDKKNKPYETFKKINIEEKTEDEKFINAVNEEIEVMDDSDVIEIVSNDNSIDKIANLLEDNINNPKPIDLTQFEEEEEKNAIISYDELVKKAGAKKIIYKTEKATINEDVKEEKIEIKNNNNDKKFKASQVISPIYGIKKQKEKKNELEEFIDLENIPVKEKKYIDEDLQKDITFLTNLKTFRSNLD